MPKRTYTVAGSSKKYKTQTGYNRKKGGLTKYSRTKVNAKTVAKFVADAQKSMKGMDTLINDSSVILTTNTNGAITVLNLIQQGNGSWNRVGRKAHLQSVRLIGAVTLACAPTATTADFAGAVFRHILVWDNQPSGAAIPTFDTIFGTTVQDGTEATGSILDVLRYDNMDRFKILMDRKIDINPNAMETAGTTDIGYYKVNFDEFIKLGNRETVFLGQSNPMTIADISTGALYYIRRCVFAGSTNSSIALDTGNFARLRYCD